MRSPPTRTHIVKPTNEAAPYDLDGGPQVRDDLPRKTTRWYHLNPHSPVMSLWDAVCVLALVFTALVTPFEVAFLPAPKRGDEALFLVNRVVDVLFLLDMATNFFRLRVSEATGEWETSLRRIAVQYLSGWFLIDFVGIASSLFDIIPLVTGGTRQVAVRSDTKSPMTSLRVVRALRLVKLIRLLGASRQLKNIQVRMGTPRATVTVTATFCEVVIYAHFSAW